ncbi:MAG: L,D-transpeptidase family protein [Azoarcus sp.]|nr:L,D-transpeptidase family protein [Azoarcus sp.]
MYKSSFRAIVLLPLFVATLLPGIACAGDEAVSAALRSLLIPAITTGTPKKPAHAELLRVYSERQFAPLWQSSGRREQLVATLSALGSDGLNPENYQPNPSLAATDDPLQRAQHELLTTELCLQALTHLQQGRLDAERFGHFWRAPSLEKPARPSPAEALGRLANDDIAALFDQFRPQTALYRGLREALAQAEREMAKGEWPQISPGPTLKPGMNDLRVVELRARLTASGHLAAESGIATDMPPMEDLRMDDLLVEAVRKFQRDHSLETDGAVGRGTLAALNQSRHDRLTQLRINLERARWIAAEQQRDHVLVDVAGYRLTYYRDATPVWSGRTQVGMPARETPELFSRITHFTVNPTWTVPPTILKKDIVPKASTDPDYLASRNIRVINRDGEEVDPATVDWNHTAGLTLRQDFGDGSALGKVAIRFANPHAIYLHDTPNQRQFKRTERAFSSGCVRVEDALELVRLLIENDGNTYQSRLDRALASGRTGNLNLPRPVPIIVAYLTAGPDEHGRITFRPDIYSRDAAMVQAFEHTQQQDRKDF